MEYEGKLLPGEEDEDADVTVAGRVMAKRVFGKLAFFTLQDESGTMQLQLEKGRLGEVEWKVSFSLVVCLLECVGVMLCVCVPLFGILPYRVLLYIY